jgi:hypothetical protein
MQKGTLFMLTLTVNWSDGSTTQASIEVQGSRPEREELVRVAIETLVEHLRHIEHAEGGDRW